MKAETERILGINFFNGSALDAVEQIRTKGGCVLITASPALTKLEHDEDYRRALAAADLVLLDSELLVFIWKFLTGSVIRKISGMDYLRCLLSDLAFRKAKTLWIVPSTGARAKTIEFLLKQGFSISAEQLYIRSERSVSGQDHEVLLEIEARRPAHVVIALRGAGQEQLGVYLRDFLLYRPSIHCVGVALGFLTGDERPISEWAERRHLGWISRLASQPRMVLPRVGIAFTVVAMILRFRSKLPSLKARWADL